MIRQAGRAANAWRPEGFAELETYYPRTRWQRVAEHLDLTASFIDLWNTSREPGPERSIAIVLTPGLFAEWLPGCFRGAHSTFRDAGYRVLQSRVRTGVSVFAQAERLAHDVSEWLLDEERFIWCGHSKGGLEILRALECDSSLRRRCIAAIAVQPPVGISHVLEYLKSSEASATQKLASHVLASRIFVEGIRDISVNREYEFSQWLQHFKPSVPTLCAASWSIEPTSWIDSWHQILQKTCPGIAHDGQFMTSDQLLPETAVVTLPRIDHAQPVLGGNGFDPGKFWSTLTQLAMSPLLQDRHGAIAQTR